MNSIKTNLMHATAEMARMRPHANADAITRAMTVMASADKYLVAVRKTARRMLLASRCFLVLLLVMNAVLAFVFTSSAEVVQRWWWVFLLAAMSLLIVAGVFLAVFLEMKKKELTNSCDDVSHCLFSNFKAILDASAGSSRSQEIQKT